MTATATLIGNIIRKLIFGEDYRSEVVALIDAQFLEYAIEFFKRVAEAKMRHQQITLDWYRQEMLSDALSKEEIAIHAGLNIKTITNMYNTARKEVVIEASLEHYDTLYEAIRDLTRETEVNIILTIKFNNVAIDLDINESLIVINALAVARAALRGGIWSAAGKQVEQPLMMTLCALHQVPPRHYRLPSPPEHKREVDFYLVDNDGKPYRCEVKLMGKGNPESADAVFARDADIFIADKLSDKNKEQLEEQGILWVELRGAASLSQFSNILKRLDIHHEPIKGNLKNRLEKVLQKVLEEPVSPSATPFTLHESAADYEASEYLIEFGE